MTLHLARDGDWVRVPLPAAVKDAVVYHYTTPTGLIGIVESDTLWASSPLALNDLSEITYGIDVLREALADRSANAAVEFLSELLHRGDLASVKDTAYFLSASADQDSLNQWMGYATQEGYAIGLDTRPDLAQLHTGTPPENLPSAPAPSSIVADWYRVVYPRDQQLQHISRILDFYCASFVPNNPIANHDHALTYLGILLPQFKHPAFIDEREVRFIATRVEGLPEYFRPGRYGVVPYVRLVTAGPGDYIYSSPPPQPLPITSVTCGPVDPAEQPLVADAARRLLRAHDYAADVTNSCVPYRS